MTEAEEIAKFVDTGKTILHRGRTFKIFNPPADEDRADSPYILKSQRGPWYALMRNKGKPYLLFGAALYGGRFACLPGWFSDKDGELKSLG